MKRIIMVVFVIIGLLAAGCMRMMNNSSGGGQAAGGLTAVSAEGTPIPNPADAPQESQNTAVQKVGSLTVTLAILPYPPAGFETSSFDVTLKDENGQAVTDASITLDLTMPAMRMPANQPEATYADNGVYQAKGRFTMRGLWRIEVIIERGGEKSSAFFDVNL